MALIAILASCSSGESAQYAGKYSGTYTFISENRTKEGTIVITSNPLVDNGILVYGVLPLNYYTSGVYKSDDSNGEVIASVLSAIGVGENTTEGVEENVKSMTTTATFDGSSIELEVKYEVELVSSLGINTEIRIVEFDGTKASN